MKKLHLLKSEEKLHKIRLLINVLTWIFVLLTIIGVVYLYMKGYLTDLEKLRRIVKEAGPWGPGLFVLLQIIQVAIPILPGGVTTLAGDLVFGHVWGFIWNYIGICMGSILGFHIAKTIGRPILLAFFSPEMIARYEAKTGSTSQFAKYFALAIFFPFAPDDFLCYLSGTTTMSYRRFIWIILLGKPLALLIYSLGLTGLLGKLFGIG